MASAIKELDASLTQAKADIKAAYEKAISEAITICEGKFNTKIAADIDAATAVLQRRIDAIDVKITSLETRIKALEDRVSINSYLTLRTFPIFLNILMAKVRCGIVRTQTER